MDMCVTVHTYVLTEISVFDNKIVHLRDEPSLVVTFPC